MEVDGKCEMASYTGPVSKPETNPDEPEDQLPSLIKDKVSNGKINTKVRCERCSSLVLSPGMAKYVTTKVKTLNNVQRCQLDLYDKQMPRRSD